MKNPIRIVSCRTEKQIDQVRRLFVEYNEFIGVDLSFQGFSRELAVLPGAYGPPAGALLLAVGDSAAAAGCVGLRRHKEGICEMKRLYVRPAFRRTGLGRRLALRIIEAARDLDYLKMRLDTLGNLSEAVALYKSLGFKQIPAYYANPLSGVTYWELDL